MLNPNTTELLESPLFSKFVTYPLSLSIVRQELQKKKIESLDENRKKKIEEILAKRRSLATTAGQVSEKSLFEEWEKREYTPNDFPELFNAINSNDLMQQNFGTIGIRRLLAKGDELMIQKVIDAHVILRLLSFLEREQHPKLQVEASWVLANMTAGTTEQIQKIITKGGIPAFEKLLKHENPDISEQAILGIGNMAGDSNYLRDLILKSSNALRLIRDIIEKFESPYRVQKATWALSNLVRGKPLPEFEVVKEVLPTFSKVIQQTQDQETLADAAWALSHHSEGAGVKLVLEANLCPALVAHINMNQNLATLIPSVRILGNLLSGTEEEANRVLETPDVIEKLVEIATKHKKRALRREACWCLANITAGTPEQIQMLIKNEEHIANLMQLSKDSPPEVVQEALYIFSNAALKASPAQMTALCDCKLIDFFLSYLRLDDAKNIKTALDAIHNVLNAGAVLAQQNNNTENLFLVKLEEQGGVELLEDLQIHPDHEVYEKVVKILETHFELEN